MDKRAKYKLWISKKNVKHFRKVSNLALREVDGDFMEADFHDYTLVQALVNEFPVAEIRPITKLSDGNKVLGAILINKYSFPHNVAFVPEVEEYDFHHRVRKDGEIRALKLEGENGGEMHRRVKDTYDLCLSHVNHRELGENALALVIFQNISRTI